MGVLGFLWLASSLCQQNLRDLGLSNVAWQDGNVGQMSVNFRSGIETYYWQVVRPAFLEFPQI